MSEEHTDANEETQEEIISRWDQIYDPVSSLIVKILTKAGDGTGYLCHKDASFLVFATAKHVVKDAYDWDEPIRILYNAGTIDFPEYSEKIFKPSEYLVEYGVDDDSAVIVVAWSSSWWSPESILKAKIPEFYPAEDRLTAGAGIAWLGFPGISGSGLCFFSGRVSNFITQNKTFLYLIDGVAIPGVSGGPVVTVSEEKIVFIGTISSYALGYTPRGDSMPGLSVALHIDPYIQKIESLKERFEKRRKSQRQDAEDDQQK